MLVIFVMNITINILREGFEVNCSMMERGGREGSVIFRWKFQFSWIIRMRGVIWISWTKRFLSNPTPLLVFLKYFLIIFILFSDLALEGQWWCSRWWIPWVQCRWENPSLKRQIAKNKNMTSLFFLSITSSPMLGGARNWQGGEWRESDQGGAARAGEAEVFQIMLMIIIIMIWLS